MNVTRESGKTKSVRPNNAKSYLVPLRAQKAHLQGKFLCVQQKSVANIALCDYKNVLRKLLIFANNSKQGIEHRFGKQKPIDFEGSHDYATLGENHTFPSPRGPPQVGKLAYVK